VKDLLQLVPALIVTKLKTTPYYAVNSDSLVIQADENRKQSANLTACFMRLHKSIVDAAAQVVPGETSEVQKQHVEKLYVNFELTINKCQPF